MYLEKPNPKYSNSSLESNSKIIVVPFGEVATSRHFDFKVIEVSEKMEINVENNTFTLDPSNKFILVKLKVRNPSNSTIELYSYDFVLEDTSNIKEIYKIKRYSPAPNTKKRDYLKIKLSDNLLKY
ncbi:DUF4352 domain-containing protein [Clostridium algidicarnis]|uniref:DUF4352 domain-containing protein n=2 Tax=Clostridium algidicarnis TaxID=37659 RepID=A0ABS6C6A1_9CLOT|nr:DUF4352 domain-containing protein [Clostridium algidicarnis]MBU3221025.1 DUF4352 domain-containing protein [Clostridium algidicarnis]MCB2287507.1 DUF4352 domain-containing protein [Clostridium algidicarnis]